MHLLTCTNLWKFTSNKYKWLIVEEYDGILGLRGEGEGGWGGGALHGGWIRDSGRLSLKTYILHG